MNCCGVINYKTKTTWRHHVCRHIKWLVLHAYIFGCMCPGLEILCVKCVLPSQVYGGTWSLVCAAIIVPIKIANNAVGMVSLEHHRQNSIHPHCIRVETEISEMDISKPQQIKVKLFTWLDTTGGDFWQKISKREKEMPRCVQIIATSFQIHIAKLSHFKGCGGEMCPASA